MMASKKPKKRHPSRLLSANKLHLVQVDAFIRPLEEFISQIKQQSIWVNDAGEALIGLPYQDVNELAKKGMEPPSALPSFAIMFETYFQVVAYCLDQAAIQRVHDQIEQFNRSVFHPLEQDTVIESRAIIDAESFLREMKTVFMSVPKDKVLRVMQEIKKGIQSSKSDVLNTQSLRTWLVKELS
jgi:hypothetical protein